MVASIINPSILAADFANLATDVKRVTSHSSWLHIDVMDGHFVPNISFGEPIISALRKTTDAFFDVHMMVSDPLFWVESIAKAGGSQYTFHIEATNKIQQTIDLIKKNGMKVGLAIKPNTPVDLLYPWIDQIDLALIMTVEPGFGGQKFMIPMMDKVKSLRSKYPNLNIEVDGGLGPDTIDYAAKAGANVIVAGSSVFGSNDPVAVIKSLDHVVKEHL